LRYEEASKRRLETEKKLAPIIAELESARISVTALARIGSKLAPAINTTELSSYGQEIEGYVRTLRELLPLELAGSTLAKVTKVPPESSQSLRLLELRVNELPDPSQLDASRDYLIVGQEKLEAYRGAALKLRTAEQRAATARVIFNS
jgi:hypothetical protein